VPLPARGALIPGAFSASAICRSDVPPLRPHDRDHVGRALVCAVNNFSYRLLARLVNHWVAERNATRLSSLPRLP
jgi:hypothetical protein